MNSRELFSHRLEPKAHPHPKDGGQAPLAEMRPLAQTPSGIGEVG